MRKKDDEKERRIRQAVIELMLEEGLNGTSIAKIARMAGVSPATVYIYYENKEDMLRDIYLECSNQAYEYLLNGIRCNMNRAQMVETLVRRYYHYLIDHPQAHCFIEQFSNCPSLSAKCNCEKRMQDLFDWIEEEHSFHQRYSRESLSAILFYPIKALAADHEHSNQQKQRQLEELIEMIQKAIL